MYYEPITVERLKEYTERVKELDALLQKKKNIISKIGSTHGIDYSRIKVTSGNTGKTSEQEHYAMSLQKINSEIDFLKYKVFECYGLVEEHEVIKAQIKRIKKWNYRKILVYRYLEKWKWSEIIQDFFEFESDYEDEKNGKYKDTVMYWHTRALEELKKISEKPYVPVAKQLTIGESNERKTHT